MVKEQSVQGLSLPEHWLLVIELANISIPQVQPLKWIDEGFIRNTSNFRHCSEPYLYYHCNIFMSNSLLESVTTVGN